MCGGMKSNKFGKNLFKLIRNIFIALFLLIIFSYSFIFYSIISGIKLKVEEAANSSSKYINGDELNSVWQSKDMNTSKFKNIQEQLIKLKIENGVKYLYTLCINGDKANFIVDGSTDNEVKLGDEYEVQPQMKSAMKGQVTSLNFPIKDKWGIFISGYAPIKDSNGNVVAIIGADMDVAIFYDLIKKLIISLILTFVFALVLTIVIIQLYSKKIIKQLNLAVEGINKLSNGDLTEKLNIQRFRT